jgi:hypothetical protein
MKAQTLCADYFAPACHQKGEQIEFTPAEFHAYPRPPDAHGGSIEYDVSDRELDRVPIRARPV